MNKVIENKMPIVIRLLRAHKVKRAYVFGSVITDRFRADSDIDLLIAFEDNLDPVEYGELYFELADKLENLLQHPVDLITEPSLQNPYFIERLNDTKVSLYE